MIPVAPTNTANSSKPEVPQVQEPVSAQKSQPCTSLVPNPAQLKTISLQHLNPTLVHSLAKNKGVGRCSPMAKQLARKRADSWKWSRYEGGGVIELNLKPEELRRET